MYSSWKLLLKIEQDKKYGGCLGIKQYFIFFQIFNNLIFHSIRWKSNIQKILMRFRVPGLGLGIRNGSGFGLDEVNSIIIFGHFGNLFKLQISNMKNNSAPIPPTHKKTKSKQLPTTSNNFSEKYFQYTKEKTFASTPKKANHTRQIISPRDSRNRKMENVSSKKKLESPYVGRNQKININMEIKNFNIYSSTNNEVSSTKDLKKKKLHKKTISCLNNLIQKQTAPKPAPKQQKKLIKHAKTKSQQNMKVNPKQWSELLTKYGKNKKDQDLVSKVAYCNRCGFCPEKKNKTNQDAFIYIQNFMKQGRYLFGVCDGHGVNGHYVSEFVKEILPENIQYYFLKNKNMNKVAKSSIQSSMKQAFQKTSKDLLQSGIDIMFSGSTTCLVYVQKQNLYCANLGDSRAVLFSKTHSENLNDPQWVYKQLSTDHKAQDKRQSMRIQMNGGRVFPYRDQDGEQMGPFRVWVKEQNIPGLAMTRSFGDYVASTVGVIDQPQILHHQITKQNKFMVIASDGLWQFISSEQVLNIVAPSFIRNDAQSAVKDLETAAVEAWKRQDQSIDDITILVVFFKYY